MVHGHLMTVVSNDRSAWDADQVEFDTESGVCVEALRHGRRSTAADLTTEDRWPAWAATAVALGFRSAAGVPATVGPGQQRIAFNMYSRQLGRFTGETLRRADAFVEQLAQALPLVLLIFERSRTITDLQSAMISRSTIDQALGVLMGQNQCSRDEAFAMLRRGSQNGNVKLRDLAATIIERYTGHAAATDPTFRRS